MSEKALRNIFIFGTIFFFIILFVLTWNSLSQVNDTRTPEVTDAVVNGKRAFQEKNCNDCHTILGIGGYFAPELTKVADRWAGSEEILQKYLVDPKKVMPGATMPNQGLTDQEAADIVVFFKWVAKVDTNNWPPEPMLAGSNLSDGQTLFSQKGCVRCHTIGDIGTGKPDLTHIGSVRTMEWLAEWLENPEAIKPNTPMPNPHLTEAEAHALAAYLAEQK